MLLSQLLPIFMWQGAAVISAAVGCCIALGMSLKAVFENRRRHQKPCELPVLNLEFFEGDFEKAKQSFISDLWKWLDQGRKNASTLIDSAQDSIYETLVKFPSRLTFHSSRTRPSNYGAPRATLFFSPMT